MQRKLLCFKSSGPAYRSILLVTLFFILMILIVTNEDDVGEDENNANSENKDPIEGQEDTTFDNFVEDPNNDLVFIRSRGDYLVI